MFKNQVFGSVGIFVAAIALLNWPLSEEEQVKRDRSVEMGPHRECISTLDLTASYALAVGLKGEDEKRVISGVADISGGTLEMKRDVARAAFQLQRSRLSSEEIERRLNDRIRAHCNPLKPL